MCRDLIRSHLHIGEPGKRRLKRAYKFGLELRVYLRAIIVLLDIAADIGVKQQGVCYLVGINAVASYASVEIETDAAVDDAEGDGRGRSELVVDYLLGVEVVNALILAGVAAVGKALTYSLEGIEYRLAERACEDAGLGGGVVGKFAGLCADLDDLALLDDYHTLTVGNGNARAV